MTTVARRTFNSTPQRDAAQTWNAIVDLLTKGRSCPARTELLAVTGIAASIVADRSPGTSPIVITCEGPQTRIYCLYDDSAIEGSDANEDILGYDPLNGDWRVSLPCLPDDLSWVQDALKKHSNRIVARDEAVSASAGDSDSTAQSAALVLDPKGFLGP
jgi:hypothetical protein